MLALQEVCCRSLLRCLSARPGLFRSLLETARDLRAVPTAVLETIESSDEKAIKNVMFEAPALEGFSSYDRMTLVVGNYERLWAGLYAPLFFTFGDFLWSTEEVVAYLRRNAGTHPTLETVLNEVISKASSNDCEKVEKSCCFPISTQVGPINFAGDVQKNDQVCLYRPESGYDVDTARELVRLLGKIAPWIKMAEGETSSSSSVHRPDPVVTILLCVLLVATPEGLDLEDPGSVDRTRDAHLWLLHRYLATRHGRKEAAGRLHKVLMALAYWEEIVRSRKQMMTLVAGSSSSQA